MPADKMLKLFIIQAISSFVARDYESGLHFLNEVKMTYAESQGTLHHMLKSLAKDIIQSLDMFSPGTSANQFADANVTSSAAVTPQQELQSHFQQPTQPAQQPQQEPVNQVQNAEPNKSVSNDLQELLERRRAKRAR